MATGGKKFPPQEQEGQPGREHEMQPQPEFVRPNYKPAGKLVGKIAVVTGGDSGIGRSVACYFALEGATVSITYVPGKEEKDAIETLDMLTNKYKHPQAKGDPIKIGVDLGDDENCKKVVQQVIDTYGCIDILVNNAAEQHMVPGIENISVEQVERVFKTNIFSHFYLIKYAVKHMKEGSCIINTTSVNAYKGNASLLDYTSTKGAIVALTRGLALHLVGRGIRVNGVSPGHIWTPLIPSSFSGEKVESFGDEVPMKRAAQPSEIGPSYVFLASEDASYYTGQFLHPNGGVVVNA
ncbi:hypothetical protein GOP47_0011607 [Adiantum capillus-veneris]|uniref:Uncharacterized protein n=1 Tax=Adiantum capillus-veneris TaxID=13818 RepID=A0A9D4UT40_ADICA|nr:hypothetical protein GOP47_0011607 [Adiantum capillus-veneris]